MGLRWYKCIQLKRWVMRVLDRRKALLGFGAAAAVSALGAAGSAFAQADPGDGRAHDVFQNGIKVGEIFIPMRPKEAQEYLEHWILYPGYIYPGSYHPEASFTVKLGKVNYASAGDFFSRAPFPEGSRYIRVHSAESFSLPGVKRL